jgi:Dockerin type I domain
LQTVKNLRGGSDRVCKTGSPSKTKKFPIAKGFDLIDVAQSYVLDPSLVGAVSRKTHGSAGTFDIDLMPPAAGIECCSGGAGGDFQIVVTFATSIVNFNSATVSGTGSVSTAITSGNQIFVNLTGVTNAQRLSVNLLGVNDGTKTADYSVQMGVLLGDVNGNGLVNSTDTTLVQVQSGQAVTNSNFRTDVNANGLINSTDTSIVQSHSGTGLP